MPDSEGTGEQRSTSSRPAPSTARTNEQLGLSAEDESWLKDQYELARLRSEISLARLRAEEEIARLERASEEAGILQEEEFAKVRAREELALMRAQQRSSDLSDSDESIRYSGSRASTSGRRRGRAGGRVEGRFEYAGGRAASTDVSDRWSEETNRLMTGLSSAIATQFRLTADVAGSIAEAVLDQGLSARQSRSRARGTSGMESRGASGELASSVRDVAFRALEIPERTADQFYRAYRESYRE